MKKIVELYDSNNLLLFLIVIIVLGIYIISLKKTIKHLIYKPIYLEEENYDFQITLGSVVELKYVITGEIVKIRISLSQPKNNNNDLEVRLVYFKIPLVNSLRDKEAGDIVRFNLNEFDEKVVYVEIINVDNRFVCQDDNEFFLNYEPEIKHKHQFSIENTEQNNSTFIERNSICYDKEELVNLLKKWLKTDEETIGDIRNYTKNTRWLYLELDNFRYFFNSDTKRRGVEDFVRNHDRGFTWRVIQNKKGNFKKVTNEQSGNSIPFLYFYSEVRGKREI